MTRRNFTSVCLYSFLALFLVNCTTQNSVTEYEYVKILPPVEPEDPCPVYAGDGTIRGLLEAFQDKVSCEKLERNKRRAWRELNTVPNLGNVE